MLRCKEIGLTIAELNELEFGFVLDMFSERAIDNNGYIRTANQNDFDKF